MEMVVNQGSPGAQQWFGSWRIRGGPYPPFDRGDSRRPSLGSPWGKIL